MISLFRNLSALWQRRIFWTLVGIAILLIVIFILTGKAMTTTEAPLGMISFEFAGSVLKAGRILVSWGEEGRLSAAFGLGLDFLFIPIYSTAIALGSVMVAGTLRKRGWPLALWGNRLAWLSWLAGFLDVVENVALVTILFSSISNPWPQIARWCAIPKFGIVFLGIVYVLFGGVVNLVSRWMPVS